MNWEGEVLILHKGDKEGQFFGRNIAYKNIFIDNFKRHLGDFIQIKINKIKGFNLFGQKI